MLQSTDFDYDLWANKLWLESVAQWPDQSQANETLTHILFAQWVWLRRVAITAHVNIKVPAEPETPAFENFQLLHDLWQTAEIEVQEDTTIDYTTFEGESHQNTFGQIRTHVLNHGTYHRGQLRGMAQALNTTDFPETDFISFLRRKI